MIALHRINRPDHDFYLNPDLIQLIEANPDTVITLTNGSKFVVAETPGEVARARSSDWRGGDPRPARWRRPVVANHPRAERSRRPACCSFPLSERTSGS